MEENKFMEVNFFLKGPCNCSYCHYHDNCGQMQFFLYLSAGLI